VLYNTRDWDEYHATTVLKNHVSGYTSCDTLEFQRTVFLDPVTRVTRPFRDETKKDSKERVVAREALIINHNGSNMVDSLNSKCVDRGTPTRSN
jgi:hypothetical protein